MANTKHNRNRENAVNVTNTGTTELVISEAFHSDRAI